MKNHKCFSLSGWWQTLCGLDAANQGFGWTSDPTAVGCTACRQRIKKGEHLTATKQQILMKHRTKVQPAR